MRSDGQLTFWRCIQEGFRRLLDFEGRSGRREYFTYVLFLLLIFVFLLVGTFLLFEIPNKSVQWILDGFLWSYIILTLSATFRRFQDVKVPGYYALLIPASIYFLKLIKENPFEWSEIVHYACLAILTLCFVWLMAKGKE